MYENNLMIKLLSEIFTDETGNFLPYLYQYPEEKAATMERQGQGAEVPEKGDTYISPEEFQEYARKLNETEKEKKEAEKNK